MHDPRELEDICSLWLNPVTDQERQNRAEFMGDELEFSEYVVRNRRIRYFTEKAEQAEG